MYENYIYPGHFFFLYCHMKYLGLCAFANVIAKALENISEAVFERKNILCNIKQVFLKIFGYFPPKSCFFLQRLPCP